MNLLNKEILIHSAKPADVDQNAENLPSNRSKSLNDASSESTMIKNDLL